jgi:hypothetical protein
VNDLPLPGVPVPPACSASDEVGVVAGSSPFPPVPVPVALRLLPVKAFSSVACAQLLEPLVPSRYMVPTPAFERKSLGVLGCAAAAVPALALAVVWKSQPATMVPEVAGTTWRVVYGPQVVGKYHHSWPLPGTLPLDSLSTTPSMMAAQGVTSRMPSSLVSRSCPSAPWFGARVWKVSVPV